jgi:5-methyltetrahydrofolate--homocysteine methyltransferase
MKVFDGGLGTVLQSRGLGLGEIPEELNLSEPEVIIDIHKQYIDAGADYIYTNTFGANGYKLKNSGYSVETIVKKAVENAAFAVEGTSAKIILDIGPLGQLIEPAGTLKFEDAYEYFKEIVIAGDKADVIVFETFTDLYELRAGILAAKENSDKPVFATMSFEEDGRTFSGVSLEAFAFTAESLGVSALGVNCSLGPKEIAPFIKRLGEIVNLPLIVKPNAGLPDSDGSFTLTPQMFKNDIEELLSQSKNVCYIGGCCGTTPDYIREISHFTQEYNPNIAVPKSACSAIKVIDPDVPQVVGERINPTGKKRFKEALKNRDYDYILSQAIEQVDAGATVLDVNVGIPEINEKEVMTILVKKIQSIVDVPLMIDSTDPEVIEAALRVYNGKAIVNSTTCELEKLSAIIPIIKKYGANIIVLTIDENGIPQNAVQRIEMAKKSLDFILEQGVPKRNIFFDCLTLSVATETAQVKETLQALRTLTDMGYSTVLGTSNISFGLPNRELINSNFLSAAIYSGLTLPIMNPLSMPMMNAFRSINLLMGYDKNAEVFIASTSTEKEVITDKKVTNSVGYYISKGLKNETANTVREMLKDTDPLEIVNNHLIAALDKVGTDFESGKIFLPQLLMSAESAQSGFSEIEKFYDKKGIIQEEKGKIILATVKGDVHDIGKNIVKTLLSSYGFNVIDLGKDVPPETILAAVLEHGVKLVGLSALMTTTLKSMEQTINLLKGTGCKVMVGGAVVTQDYALSIGADFFGKDAKSSVDIAKSVSL